MSIVAGVNCTVGVGGNVSGEVLTTLGCAASCMIGFELGVASVGG